MDFSLRTIRKNIAAFAVLAIIASFMVVGSASAQVAVDIYGDVDGTEWYADDVQWGLDSGILDETQAFFRGGDNSTRAEFFKMTAAGAGIPEAACDELTFLDLDAGHWACGWITALAEAGIVSGDGPGSATPGHVRPNDNILRAEAGKVVVEGYGLLGTSLASDVFNDVVAGVWYDETSGIAYDNCVFQGVGGTMNLEPGRNIVRAEGIAVVHRGAEPTSDCTTYVGPSGALTVSVDGSTPASSLIPRNASGVLYTVWGFEASNDEPINIEGLTIHRTGLGDPQDFDEVRLYVDGMQQGSRKNINNDSNSADFALAGTPIQVPPGAKLLVGSVGDMDAMENSENALCINGPEDVIAYGANSGELVDVGGSFAACGEYMYTSSATVGTVTYTTTDFGGDINVGDTDVDMTRLRIEVDGEDGILQFISIKQTGSADPEDFASLLWYYENAPIEGLDCDWADDYWGCDFTGSGLSVVDGGVMNLDFRNDVVGGIGNTAAWDIKRDTDIFILGGQHGYGLNVEEDGASMPPDPREIVGGRLAFSTSVDNPTVGDVAPNAQDHDFLGFNASTAGDAVDVTEYDMTVFYEGNALLPGEVDDLKVWRWDTGTEAWKIAASALDPANGTCTAWPVPASCVQTYEDIITLPSTGTTPFMATMDVDTSAPDGAEYRVGFGDAVVGVTAEYTVDDDPVLAADISGLPLVGNWQTVAPPHLTVEVSSAPWDQTVVRNQPELDLVGYDLTATTASDLIVRTIQLTCTDETVVLTGTCDDFFTNLELYHKDGGSLFFLDDSAFSAGLGVFNNVNLNTLSGQTEKVLARANGTSSPDAGDEVSFGIATNSDVAADDEFGFALLATAVPLTNQIDVCPAVSQGCLYADGEAPLMTFMANGAIEVSIEDTLNDEIILDGTAGVLVAEITIRELTDAEPIDIRKLRLTNDIDATGLLCDASGISSVNIPYPNADDEYSFSLQSLANDVEFAFDDAGDRRVRVPRDGTIILPVTVDTNSIGGGGAMSGDCVNLGVELLENALALPVLPDYNNDDIDIEAVGASSGILLGGGYLGDTNYPLPLADDFILGGAGYVADVYGSGSEVFTIRNNKPMVTTNFELSTGPDLYGLLQSPRLNHPVLGFNVSVEGTDSMTMYDIELLTTTGGGANTCAPAGSYELYREETWLIPGPALTVPVVDTFMAADFTNNVGLQVSGGNDDDFLVTADTSACTFNATSPDIMSVSIADNDGLPLPVPTAFLWDDTDATGILDIGVTNDTGVSDTTLFFG
ncbi:S-layer homology domain-containing protein [Patescibacteria group bacterium]